MTLPRVLGIEACGVVASCPGGEFQEGQQVCAVMGGMGRGQSRFRNFVSFRFGEPKGLSRTVPLLAFRISPVFDGGYAEYTLVPVANAHAFHSKSLSWSTLGAIPEMLQTSYGSLTLGCDGQKGQSILIRGGTSSIGMATAILAKQRGMTVLSTTRSEHKSQILKDKIGVDHVIIDDGKDVASKVRQIMPRGVDCALELVGADTLKDTLRSVKVKGTVCFTGMLSNSWIIKDLYPMGKKFLSANTARMAQSDADRIILIFPDLIPNGVRLTAYSGGADNMPGDVLQAFINAVEAGKVSVPIDKVFTMDQIAEAHAYMVSICIVPPI